MPPLHWLRVLAIFASISFLLAVLDEAMIWFLPPLAMRELVLGLAAGAMVYLMAYRIGSILRFVIDKRIEAGTLIERGESILKEIAACSGVTATLLVFESSKLITFSVSDGHNRSCICISSGMISSLSRDAIAGVLAHECGHINANHPRRLALLLALLATVKMSGGISAAIVVMVILTYLYMQREWEFAADKKGAECVGPSALITAFNEYKSVSGEKDLSRLGEIFSAHPGMHRRIAALSAS